MIFKKFIILLFIVLMATCVHAEWELNTYDTLFGTTDEPVSVFWDSSAYEYTVYVWFTHHANRDTSVSYEVWDDTVIIDTVVIDQTDESIAGQWHLLGTNYPISSGVIRVTLRPDSDDSCSADAVKISMGVCDIGVVIDNDTDGASTTGSWTVSSGVNPYGPDSVYGSGTDSSHTWMFTNLEPSVDGVSYEYNIHSVERGFDYINAVTTNPFATFLIPKSGHYFFQVRTLVDLSTENNAKYVNALCEEQLQTFIDRHDGWIDVTITEGMPDAEVRAAIIAAGMKSEWVSTENVDSVATCIGENPFWIYGTLAPPGPIVIE